MTKIKKEVAVGGLTAAVAAVASAQVASAADVAPPEEYVHDWSGVYIGAAAGMIFGGDFPMNYTSEYDADDDFIFGGFIGFNHQFHDSNLVVGGEIAVQSGFEAEGDPEDDNEYEVNYIVDGKLKLGFAMDEFLVYVFGGPTFIDSTYTYSGDDDDYSDGGINYGIGADWMVTDHFSIGAEVLGRTIIDAYGWSGDEEDKTHWQGMLRAAFHLGP